MPHCPNCGGEISAQQSFCRGCGEDVSEIGNNDVSDTGHESTSNEEPAEQGAYVEKSRIKKLNLF